jgi:trans-aconitate methyltransferase
MPSLRFSQVLDVGCGTGAGGTAAASLLDRPPGLLGIDRLGWTLEEAAFTYRHFGLRHRVQRVDLRRPRIHPDAATLVVAAYTINELDEDTRAFTLEWLCQTLQPGSALLIVEPIAKTVTPWWSEWATALRPMRAREDEWRFATPLPNRLRLMDKAAGLDHQVRKARTLWIPPSA